MRAELSVARHLRWLIKYPCAGGEHAEKTIARIEAAQGITYAVSYTHLAFIDFFVSRGTLALIGRKAPTVH